MRCRRLLTLAVCLVASWFSLDRAQPQQPGPPGDPEVLVLPTTGMRKWPRNDEFESRAARRLLDPEVARAAGFVYEGIGRASSSLAELPETKEREPELER